MCGHSSQLWSVSMEEGACAVTHLDCAAFCRARLRCLPTLGSSCTTTCTTLAQLAPSHLPERERERERYTHTRARTRARARAQAHIHAQAHTQPHIPYLLWFCSGWLAWFMVLWCGSKPLTPEHHTDIISLTHPRQRMCMARLICAAAVTHPQLKFGQTSARTHVHTHTHTHTHARARAHACLTGLVRSRPCLRVCSLPGAGRQVDR